MKKTLTTILCVLSLANCTERPSRKITVEERGIEEKLRSIKLEEADAKEYEKFMTMPVYFTKSFEELLAEPALTVEDFLELIQYVKTPTDLEKVIKRRKIHYAQKGADDLSGSLDLEYGPPLQTHNLGYGVCDELATYSLPFLLNMPEFKNVTLVEIHGPRTADNDELPEVLIVQDRRGRWHPLETNGTIVRDDYRSQKEATIVGLTKQGYIVSGNVSTEQANNQDKASSFSLPRNYKKAIVIKTEADTIIKEDAAHALVVFQDQKNEWHFYSNTEFSTKTYASPGEATAAVATGIRYIFPEIPNSVKTREITSIGRWLYDEEEAKKLRPSDDLCLP